ncbi:hypothetical protein AB4520_16000 [Vibrio renipiscarius]|uniref:hypothetical protein n=1 Tax=Vibrio renipiscarius TaxID=1461322 RepID=UPI003550C9F5
MIVCSDMTLLRRFHGSENGLNLSSERASVLEHIAQGAKRIDAREAVFYLSAYYQKSVRYYVVCSDPLLMSHLSLWLNSALGTARNYVVRTQTQSELNYEQVLYERYPHGVLCIEQLPTDAIQFRAELNTELELDDPFTKLKSDKAFIERRIEQTLCRWKQQPLIKQTVKRPLGRLLRDLLLACEDRQLQLAQNTYWEIRERQLLEQRNLIAVELQVHAAGEQWSRIVTHSELDWLLQGMVSKRVNEIVLETFARHLHLDIENLSALNWVALAERVVDQQGFFLRCPNLANVASNQRYWQYWAVFATALGYDVEPYLPRWMDTAWVEQLRQCRSQLFAVNAMSLAEVESSPLDNLLVQAKTLENAMQVVEYALRCFEHELPSLLSWLFALPVEQQHTLSQLPLLSARWAQWQLTHAITVDHTVDAQTFWCEWFSGQHAQFWVNEDSAREQSAQDVDFHAIANAIRTTLQAERARDRLPTFMAWMREHTVLGTPDLWLEINSLIALDGSKSWGSYLLLSQAVTGALHCGLDEDQFAALLDTLVLVVDEGLDKDATTMLVAMFARLANQTTLSGSTMLLNFWRAHLAPYALKHQMQMSGEQQALVNHWINR